MPIVNLQTVGTLSKEQKASFIKEVTELTAKITGKPSNYVYVRIEEVEREDFGIGGKQLG